MPPETPNTLKLTAADLILIGEALRIAEDQLRYGGSGPSGPRYDRSLHMASLRQRVTVALGATVVAMEVQP